MAFLRPLIVIVAAAAAVTIVSPAESGRYDACAQRVIRDWYSGGRVDGRYPLACYRAAIRALPEDVLSYSSADKDIARALAYAQRGSADPAGSTAGSGPHARSRPSPRAPTATPNRAARPPGQTTPAAPEGPPSARPQEHARTFDGRARLASGSEVESAGDGVPYPVLVLATLAGLLLVSAGTAALARRRR